MVGTSMIENTDADLCEELWNCDIVRLPYSGGTTYNMKRILDICFSSKNEIKTVYWELDEFQLLGSATEPRYPLPEYLYRSDYKEDLSYLLNLDIFYHYGVNNILGTLRGENQPAERRHKSLSGDYSKKAMLAAYSRPEQLSETSTLYGSVLQERADENLQNIEYFLQKYPETEFVFFMPPFSVLYWDRELRTGKFQATMDCVRYALEHLLVYENVRIYFYQNEEDIITNLDNYKDYSHYGSWINDTLTQYIAEDKNRVTSDNFNQIVNEMITFINSYDFEELLSDNSLY